MKRIAITCAALAVALDVGFSQFQSEFSVTPTRTFELTDRTAQTAVTIDAAPSTLERVAWLAGATATFSLFDYVGYNATKNEAGTAPAWYRVIQTTAQLGISYFLYEQCGLPTAISFNLIWWTGGDEFAYYGWGELLNPGGSWESRGILKRAVFQNGAGHFYWTPVGLARGGRRGTLIPGNTLAAQAVVGAVVAVTITIALD